MGAGFRVGNRTVPCCVYTIRYPKLPFASIPETLNRFFYEPVPQVIVGTLVYVAGSAAAHG